MEPYDFTERVNRILSENRESPIKPPPKCFICNDEGRIPYFKIINNIRYEIYCHCTCEIGQTFIYEGRYCKDKSPYRMASIEEILTPSAIEELKQTNKDKRDSIYENKRKLLTDKAE